MGAKKSVTIQSEGPDKLPVMEHFYTLQGEGSWTGTAAYFVRLAGCDVGCFWCDVKESWGVSRDQFMSCEAILAAVRSSEAERVVITGGEPSLHDLTQLTRLLREHGYKVHMETAGTNDFRGEFDWICLSPKKFLAPIPESYQHVDELKIIIYNQHDFTWAESHAQHCGPNTRLFLQVEWGKREEMTPAILDYVKAHPQWQLSIQTHKWIGIP